MMMNILFLIAILANPLVFEVPGLTCPTCVPPVKKTLALVDGVNHVKVDWRARTVSVSLDPKAGVSRADLAARLAKAGFPVGDSKTSTVNGPRGDVLLIETPPKEPARLSVWGKVTIVAVCTPACAPCDVFKRDAKLFAQRVNAVALRLVVIDGPGHPANHYLPQRADIPFVYVYDQTGQLKYAGGTKDQVVYTTVENILGIGKP
jgi:copper chaperone CopZ